MKVSVRVRAVQMPPYPECLLWLILCFFFFHVQLPEAVGSRTHLPRGHFATLPKIDVKQVLLSPFDASGDVSATTPHRTAPLLCALPLCESLSLSLSLRTVPGGAVHSYNITRPTASLHAHRIPTCTATTNDSKALSASNCLYCLRQAERVGKLPPSTEKQL